MLPQVSPRLQSLDSQLSALFSMLLRVDQNSNASTGSQAVRSPTIEKTEHQKFKMLLDTFLATDTRVSRKYKDIRNNGAPVSLARIDGGDEFWMAVGGEMFNGDLSEFQRAMGKIFEETLLEHCQNIEDTLEVGSGFYPINSLLTGIPAQVRQQIQISDFCPKVVAKYNEEHKPILSMKVLDCKKLSSQLGTRRFSCIVMNDVLSTFIREDLVKVCREAFKVLLPPSKIKIFDSNKYV